MKNNRVRTALLLAAGTGSRLSPLTDASHKCLTEVNGIPILQQQIECLEHWGFEDLIVVVGHQSDRIREFLSNFAPDLNVSYIHNSQYRTTNNLYSLWLARKEIERSFLLLECDLFFDAGLLSGMLHPDRIALATQQSWMNGTTVTLDDSQRVAAFQIGGATARNSRAYKTVNIHSLSLSTWRRMGKCLDAYVSAGRVNDYYEVVFRDMTLEGTFAAQAVSFDEGKWYEIDTLKDLDAAESLFRSSSFHEAKNAKTAGPGRNLTKPCVTENNARAAAAPQPRQALLAASEAQHG